MAEWRKLLPSQEGLKKAANDVLGFPLLTHGPEGLKLLGGLIIEAGPYAVFGLTALNRIVYGSEFNLWQASAFAVVAFGVKAIVEATSQRGNIYGIEMDPNEPLSPDFIERLRDSLTASGRTDVASKLIDSLKERPRY